MPVSFEQIRADEKINTYIRQADASMRAMGYTEHSFAHVTRCAYEASRLLEQLGYPGRRSGASQCGCGRWLPKP